MFDLNCNERGKWYVNVSNMYIKHIVQDESNIVNKKLSKALE